MRSPRPVSPPPHIRKHLHRPRSLSRTATRMRPKPHGCRVHPPTVLWYKCRTVGSCTRHGHACSVSDVSAGGSCHAAEAQEAREAEHEAAIAGQQQGAPRRDNRASFFRERDEGNVKPGARCLGRSSQNPLSAFRGPSHVLAAGSVRACKCSSQGRVRSVAQE